MGHSQRLRLNDIQAVLRLLGNARDLRHDFTAQRLAVDGDQPARRRLGIPPHRLARWRSVRPSQTAQHD